MGNSGFTELLAIWLWDFLPAEEVATDAGQGTGLVLVEARYGFVHEVGIAEKLRVARNIYFLDDGEVALVLWGLC